MRKAKPEKHRVEQISSPEQLKRRSPFTLALAVTLSLLIGVVGLFDVTSVTQRGLLLGNVSTLAFASENASADTSDAALSLQAPVSLSTDGGVGAILANDTRQMGGGFSDLVIILLTIIVVLGFLLIVENRRKENKRNNR
jgi:hypothetical protein